MVPKWKASAFASHQKETDLTKLGYSYEELLAIAWLMSIRREVIDRHFTWLCSISGRHRSGKSLIAATLGYILDPTFMPNFEERILYEPKQLLVLLKKLRKERTLGAVIIIDEAGQSVSAMDWFERWQKAISKATMILGYIYPIILFNAPIRDFVNSPIRKMFHAHMRITRYTNDFSNIQPYETHHDDITKKTWWKKPRIDFAGQYQQLDKIRITLAPDIVRGRYENIEALEKDKLIDKFQEDVDTSDVITARQSLDPNAVIKTIVEKYQIYQTKNSKPERVILDARLIRFRFNIPADMAQYIKSEAERVLVENRERLQAEADAAVKGG